MPPLHELVALSYVRTRQQVDGARWHSGLWPQPRQYLRRRPDADEFYVVDGADYVMDGDENVEDAPG